MRLMLGEIAKLAGGALHGADVDVSGMSHDTRVLNSGDLFVALPGERVDGHDFLASAAEAGAAAALVARRVDHPLPQVQVADPQVAMGLVAAGWRQRLDLTVIGITGSNGKTTLKEMITAILSTQGPTLSTQGNYNNEIGLPLTLSRLTGSHRFAVLEMGASGPGDIRYLANLARPDIGVVTNAAPAHLEGFGSIEGVARTKGEMFSGLPAGGMAVINADDDFLDLWRSMAAHCRVLTFGLSEHADIRANVVDGVIALETPAGSAPLELQLPGRHNLLNALAATAVGIHLGLAPADMAAALGRLQSLPGRLQVRRDARGWCLIDDTYNANPGSLKAGLQVVADMEGESWLVLGDMAELGPDSDRLHADMGPLARQLGVTRLLAVGPATRLSVEAFGTGAEHFESHEQLLRHLTDELHPGVNCLVKGSRSMGMERIVQALTGEKR